MKPKRERKPQGEPVHPFSSVPPKARLAVDQALSIIQKIHGDGVLEQIPLQFRKVDSVGGYSIVKESKTPSEFVFKSGRNISLETIIHEIGHALDHQALGEPNIFASLSTEFRGATDVLEVMEAITASVAYQTVKSYRDGQVINRRVINQDVLTYHLDKREWFARAYVQYITIRSEHPKLLQFIHESNLENNPNLVYPEAWSEQDFAPILEALEQLFLRKRWIK